ncbi:hypothetical protein L6452_08163 [Arctium lappa]|uniref:Uncharacterized protein n=1 Tax=Arctium lappa TaxID=4217 RepID=A0ACB9DGZ2_ARCLA|nr:hypothetical protein L6452_08163 [Arctium lappa]
MLVTNECELLDSGMNDLFTKTKVLYLRVDGINDLGDGLGTSLHNLRVLHICECTKLRYLFTIRVANALKQLESLIIDQCGMLETLVDSHENCEVEVIKFPALKFLLLKELPMLMSLCKGGNVLELPQLEELKLKSLPNFTSIYQHFLKKEATASKLKTLHINDMEKLKEIWPSQLSNNDQVISSQLKEIRVEGCDSLVNLFPSNPMSSLHHLEELTVKDCSSIDVIFNIDLGSSSSSSSSCVVAEIEEEANSSNLRYIQVDGCEELREVWRVKGVNDDLPILGFQNVECVEIKFCKRLRNVFTPTTSNFDMKAVTKILLNDRVREEYKSTNWLIDLIRKSHLTPRLAARPYEMVESSQVEETNVVAFPSYLIHTFPYLRTLDIIGFKRMEVVFEIESSNSRKLTTTLNNQQPPVLPHLKDLYLFGMERMTHLWKYDWNQFLTARQGPISSSFPQLASIRVESCNRIKYLFSPLIAKLLSNLSSIAIYRCDAIEKVVSTIDNEYEEIATSIFSYTNANFFPHLDVIDLYGLKSLRCIDGIGANRLNSLSATSIDDKFQCSQLDVTYSSFCRYLKTIKINRCDALLNVIPSHAVGQMPKLEEVRISYCNSLREIFETEGVNKDVGDKASIGEGSGDQMDSARLTNATLLELSNLKILLIEGCNSLKYIFTSSTLESLKKLQELRIKDCSVIQVIVKQEDNGLIMASKDVVFPRLKSLTLGKLEKLTSFFLGKNDFRWPLLDKVEIYGCPQMMIFTPGRSMAPKLKYINTWFGKHSLECGLNFDWTNAPLEQNQLYNSSMCSTSETTEYLQFPWSFSNLIEVDASSSHELRWKKTIFPSIDELVKEENVGDIEEADKVNDETQSADDVKLLISKKKQVKSMDHPPTSSSSCIWKINFSNLTKVSLQNCHYLEHVFSYGMTGSLVQLQELHISHCPNMKVIVEQVQDSETEANEVVSFPCLNSLRLTYLKSLKGFCLGSDQAFQWPSLTTLEIIDCTRMTVFTNGQSTTPKLKVIRTRFGLWDATEDLNSFIRTKILQEEY